MDIPFTDVFDHQGGNEGHDIASMDPSCDYLIRKQKIEDVRLTVVSQVARSSDERVVALLCDENLAEIVSQPSVSMGMSKTLDKTTITKKLSNNVVIAQLLQDFFIKLRHLLTDIKDCGYRSAQSWKTEVVAMLIALHSGATDSAKHARAKIKEHFSEAVYANALNFSKTTTQKQAQNWFSDLALVDKICLKSGISTAIAYQLAIA